MLFILAWLAALFLSVSAARRRFRSLMRVINASCSRLSFAAHPVRSRSRSSSSRFSSAARSSRSRSFSRLTRSRASNPAFSSFCFFFSFRLSSSSCRRRVGSHDSRDEQRAYLFVRDVHQRERRGFLLRTISAERVGWAMKEHTFSASSPSASFLRAFFKSASSFLIIPSNAASLANPSSLNVSVHSLLLTSSRPSRMLSKCVKSFSFCRSW